MNIPQTIWSNNSEKIIQFARNFSDIIVKPTCSVQYYLDERPYTFWATKISHDYLIKNKNSLSKTFSIYQEYINKISDIRVTIIGDKIFSCEMIYPPGYSNYSDWRIIPEELIHKEIQLPKSICSKLLEFNKKMNIDFGAIDLIKTSSDEYYFLESNVNGQWLWIERFTKLPISNAIADHLFTKAQEYYENSLQNSR